MTLDSAKRSLLSQAGSLNHFNRSAYFNRQSKKFSSLEAIEDHDIEWLRTRI